MNKIITSIVLVAIMTACAPSIEMGQGDHVQPAPVETIAAEETAADPIIISTSEPEQELQLQPVSVRDDLEMQIDYCLDAMHLTDDDPIEVYRFNELTAEILENRKGKWIVEILHGVVDNEDGDGTCEDGYYISYRDIPGAYPGRHIRTISIYNPENNSIDDILERFDFVLD